MNGIDSLGLSFVVENTLCWDVNRIDTILCFFSEDILVYVKLRKSLYEWIKEGSDLQILLVRYLNLTKKIKINFFRPSSPF